MHISEIRKTVYNQQAKKKKKERKKEKARTFHQQKE
jgi:hypothetical protein